MALVLVAVALVYLRALGGDFILADASLVTENDALRHPESLSALLGEPLWSEWRYWRPLAALFLSGGLALGGGEAWGIHVLAWVGHLIAVWAAGAVVRRVTGDPTLAWTVALWFGLHPVQVESVAWASALNEVLWGLFALVAMGSFQAWRDRGSRGVPWATVGWFGAALLSKETAITWLAVFAVMDLVRGRGGAPRPVGRAHGPLLVTAVLYLVARVIVFGGFDLAMQAGAPPIEASGWLRFQWLGWMVATFFDPLPLSACRDVGSDATWGDGHVWLGMGAVVLGVWGLELAIRRRSRALAVGLVVVAATLAPAAMCVDRLGPYPVADRYLYVAVFGGAVSILWTLQRWLPQATVPLALLVAVVSVAASSSRFEGFDGRLARIRAELVLHRTDARLHATLGSELLRRYRAAPNPAVLLGARSAFRSALEHLEEPRYALDTVVARVEPEARVGVAWCEFYADEQEGEAAVASFGRLARRWPERAQPRVGLGVSLARIGELELATEALERALELAPGDAEARLELARVYDAMGRAAEAEEVREAGGVMRPK